MAEAGDQYLMINVNLMIVISKGYEHGRDGTKKRVGIPLRWWGRFSPGLHQTICTQPGNRDDQRATTTARLHWTPTQFGHKMLHLSNYHWQELPQVSFWSQSFVVTNTCLSPQTRWQTRVCCDKTRLLPRPKYACCDKTFVVTRLCLSRQKFCWDRYLLWQTCICHDQSFVGTSMLLLQHKQISFVVIKLCLSQQIFIVTKFCRPQTYFCSNKRCVLLRQKMCFVTTNTCLWRQTCLLQQKFCCDKNDTCGSSHQWYLTAYENGESSDDWQWKGWSPYSIYFRHRPMK